MNICAIAPLAAAAIVTATMRRGVSLLLAALAALTGVGVFTASAQEDPTNIVADQIRAQGFKCDSPQSAKRDGQASKPDEPVWILQCESGSYRVRLICAWQPRSSRSTRAKTATNSQECSPRSSGCIYRASGAKALKRAARLLLLRCRRRSRSWLWGRCWRFGGRRGRLDRFSVHDAIIRCAGRMRICSRAACLGPRRTQSRRSIV